MADGSSSFDGGLHLEVEFSQLLSCACAGTTAAIAANAFAVYRSGVSELMRYLWHFGALWGAAAVAGAASEVDDLEEAGFLCYQMLAWGSLYVATPRALRLLSDKPPEPVVLAGLAVPAAGSAMAVCAAGGVELAQRASDYAAQAPLLGLAGLYTAYALRPGLREQAGYSRARAAWAALAASAAAGGSAWQLGDTADLELVRVVSQPLAALALYIFAMDYADSEGLRIVTKWGFLPVGTEKRPAALEQAAKDHETEERRALGFTEAAR